MAAPSAAHAKGLPRHTLMDVQENPARLVAFPSVVGTPNDAIMGWMRDHCQAAGAALGSYQQTGIAAIVCGPGDIGRAHRLNEYMQTGELAECQTGIEPFAARLAA
jgi:acetylornithine deacetylase/succinyl-diaminopimelate desuccinylase-like protein